MNYACEKCGAGFDAPWCSDWDLYKFCRGCAIADLKARHVPAVYRHATFRILDPAVAAVLADREASVYLHGDVGTGKTFAAWAVINDQYIDEAKLGWKFVTFEGLLRQLRSTFRRKTGDTEEEIFERLAATKLLVLDDLGGIRQDEASAWALGTIFEVVNARVINGRRTIVTSNKKLSEIARDFDPRVASRLAVFKVVPMQGEDRRLPK